MNKINKIKQLLGLEVKLEQKALSNGAVLEAESFEAGQPVFVVAEDEMIPVPVGEYEMEDGSVLVVSEEGVIGEIKSGEAEEEAAPEEEVVMEEEKTPKKVVESTVKESHFSDEQIGELADLVFAKLEERLETYTVKAGEIEEEVVEEVKEEVELKEIKVEAAVEPRVHTPEKQPVKKEFKHNANRHLTVKDRVLQKLSN